VTSWAADDVNDFQITVEALRETFEDCMTLRTTPLKSELTIMYHGRRGAVAVGVSAARQLERA